MPKAIPDYVPREVVDAMRARGMWGLNDLAKNIGWPTSTMCHFFRDNQHTVLFTFNKVCDALMVTIDDGVNLLNIEDDMTRMHLWDGLIRKRYKTYKLCADKAGISEDYLTKLLNGEAGKKIREDYQEVKDALGWSLKKLAEILDSGRQE